MKTTKIFFASGNAYFTKEAVPEDAGDVYIKTPAEVFNDDVRHEQEALGTALLRSWDANVVVSSDPARTARYLLERKYWEEVESDAQSIWDDIKSHDLTYSDAVYERMDKVRCSMSDSDVLSFSRNVDYEQKQGLSDRNDPLGSMAMWAYYGDVQHALCDLGYESHKPHLGLCEECEGGRGFVEPYPGFIALCTECKTLDSLSEAIGAAIKAREVQPCSKCGTHGYLVEGDTTRACDLCQVFDSDEQANEYKEEYHNES